MAKDKYSAVWLSHTSISDFRHCPRAYYLKHVYRDPKTGNKVKIMSPPLALGQAVHDVIEAISVLPTEDRFKVLLMDRFEEAWENVTGKKGGFIHEDVEAKYKNKGRDMIKRMVQHPGPIANKAVKIKQDLPYFWLSEEDNIILCGKVDWLEYLEETDSVHIIDFKTGKNNEDGDSLQLPIYYLVVLNTQPRKVSKASYWYLDRQDELTPKELPDEKSCFDTILEIGRNIKVARQLERFKCDTDGCKYCQQMESVFRGDAEFVYTDPYGYDVYLVQQDEPDEEDNSVIL